MDLHIRLALLAGLVLTPPAVAGWIDVWQTPTAPILDVPAPTLEDIRTWAVVNEARRHGADPKLMLQISRQENYRGIPDAWSPTGCCVGIMQIHVREWLGKFHETCGGSDLIDQLTNACYGVLIFAGYLQDPCQGDTTCALRSYFMGPEDRHLASGARYVERVLGRPDWGWDF